MYHNLYQFFPEPNENSRSRSALPDAALIEDDWLDRLGYRMRAGVAGVLRLTATIEQRLATRIDPGHGQPEREVRQDGVRESFRTPDACAAQG